MISEIYYDIDTYRLRCGSPMPIMRSGSFVVHTFGVEYLIDRVYMCTSRLPASSEFRGRGGNLLSANFTRLNVKEEVYQGKTVIDPGKDRRFLDESALPFSPF